MPLIPDSMAFRQRLGALPVTTYQAGERVLVAGSKTGRLLILKKGAVAIVKDNIEIAKAAEAGAVFGELSALLDQPLQQTCAPWSVRNFMWQTLLPCKGRTR